MGKKNNLTPVTLAAGLKENLNAKGTMKAQFKEHFLSRFSEEELVGIKIGIEHELHSRKQALVDDKIKFLEEMGYKVSK